MSKNMLDDIRENIDANAAYLRDCIIKGDVTGEIKAEINLKKLDIDLYLEFGGML